MITIYTVGKKHETWVDDGIQRYQKRLRKPWDIYWQLIPHSSAEGDRAREEESATILKRLDATDFVVLLDETGTQLSSPALSTLCSDQFIHGRSVVMIIGGAYGVDETLKQRADTIWSLSDLVFPHQLVRLILTEQLYRAQEIALGGSYHHQ